jgi:hypothetical protein
MSLHASIYPLTADRRREISGVFGRQVADLGMITGDIVLL